MSTHSNQQSDYSSSTADLCLQAVCQTSGVVAKNLDRFGNTGVGDYASILTQHGTQALQSRDDLEKIVAQQVESLFDKSLAQRAVDQLRQCPVTLTANHHGVDYFAQSVQGTLALSRADAIVHGPGVVIVLACGNIPLDNLTYPQGMLVYDQNNDPLSRIPRKIPLMSNSKRRQLVSAAGAFDLDTLGRAAKRIETLIAKGEVRSTIGDSALDLIGSVYSDQSVLALESYSEQASVINSRVWQRLFSTPSTDLVYLELEKITAKLICCDLEKPDSINSLLLFDSKIRSSLVAQLDKSPSCWDVDKLLNEKDIATPSGAGTVLFWAVTDNGRPVALHLDEGHEGARLLGTDSKGNSLSYPLQAEVISAALENGQLIPSLFMSFLNLALLRGLTCLGGYYQAEYLPAMARGLGRVFREHTEFEQYLAAFDETVGDDYLSGMQMVVAKSQSGLIPAGPLEIIASGGLSGKDMQTIDDTSVREAHLGSLLESVSDLPVASQLQTGWQVELAGDLLGQVGERLVVKDLG